MTLVKMCPYWTRIFLHLYFYVLPNIPFYGQFNSVAPCLKRMLHFANLLLLFVFFHRVKNSFLGLNLINFWCGLQLVQRDVFELAKQWRMKKQTFESARIEFGCEMWRWPPVETTHLKNYTKTALIGKLQTFIIFASKTQLSI